MRIGLDLLGSDRSPIQLLEAVEEAVQQFPQVEFIAFGDQQVLDSFLVKSSLQKKHNLIFHLVTETIEMKDEPILSLRQKKNSSLVWAMKLLKKRIIDGVVSAGNTGALIAAATLFLPLLPSIKRPALLALIPTEKDSVAIIDVGGNVTCKASHLIQFAQMGIAYQSCRQGLTHPRVGLLNIGVESKKGTSEVRQAYQLLESKSKEGQIVFIGNIEGRQVFQGDIDVLVTDGFTGNVLLKASEGMSFFILQKLQQTLNKELSTEQKNQIFHSLKNEFDYEEHRGAIICGVDGVVVKCHGQISHKGFLNGIKGAIELVQSGFIQRIKRELTEKAI